MSGTMHEVWIEAGAGSDLVRADAIVMLRLDGTGRLTAQLRDDAKVSVTLLEGSSGAHPPDDFHRKLIKTKVLPYVITGEMTAELFSETFEFKGDVKLNVSK